MPLCIYCLFGCVAELEILEIAIYGCKYWNTWELCCLPLNYVCPLYCFKIVIFNLFVLLCISVGNWRCSWYHCKVLGSNPGLEFFCMEVVCSFFNSGLLPKLTFRRDLAPVVSFLCLCVVLQCTGDLSRVGLASQPMIAGDRYQHFLWPCMDKRYKWSMDGVGNCFDF